MIRSHIHKGGTNVPISVAWNDGHIYYLHTHLVASEEFEDPAGNPISGSRGIIHSNIWMGGVVGPITVTWNDDHIYYLHTDQVVSTEFLDPSGNPITGTKGIIKSVIWKDGTKKPITVAWNNDHIYYLHTHQLASVEFQDPGDNSFSGVHGIIKSDIQKGGAISPITVGWNDDHIYYLHTHLLPSEEFCNPGENPISETVGIIRSEIWKGGTQRPITVAWNNDNIYYLHTYQQASENFNDDVDNPIAGTRGIIRSDIYLSGVMGPITLAWNNDHIFYLHSYLTPSEEFNDPAAGSITGTKGIIRSRVTNGMSYPLSVCWNGINIYYMHTYQQPNKEFMDPVSQSISINCSYEPYKVESYILHTFPAASMLGIPLSSSTFSGNVSGSVVPNRISQDSTTITGGGVDAVLLIDTALLTNLHVIQFSDTIYYYDSAFKYGGSMGGSMLMVCNDFEDRVIESGTLNDGDDTCFFSQNTITIPEQGGTYVVENGATLVLKARQKIFLQPGFFSKSGSYGHFYISDIECPPPILITGDNLLMEPVALNDDLIQVFPNPTTGIIQIKINTVEVEEKTMISIYDMVGSLINEWQLTGYDSYEIDLKELNTGLYVIWIQSGNQIYQNKILKF